MELKLIHDGMIVCTSKHLKKYRMSSKKFVTYMIYLLNAIFKSVVKLKFYKQCML